MSPMGPGAPGYPRGPGGPGIPGAPYSGAGLPGGPWKPAPASSPSTLSFLVRTIRPRAPGLPFPSRQSRSPVLAVVPGSSIPIPPSSLPSPRPLPLPPTCPSRLWARACQPDHPCLPRLGSQRVPGVQEDLVRPEQANDEQWQDCLLVLVAHLASWRPLRPWLVAGDPVNAVQSWASRHAGGSL
eukprot:767849-Hanusia_phi.AAC.2